VAVPDHALTVVVLGYESLAPEREKVAVRSKSYAKLYKLQAHVHTETV
jgi:hypothetical protein